HTRWPRDWSSDVCSSDLKSSLGIAREYLDLVDDARLFEPIAAELERTVATVLEIVEARELLDRHPTLQRSIRLRNPYVDPMNARSEERRVGKECRARW